MTTGQSRTTGRLVGAVILLSAAATVGTERSLDVWMVPHAHCDVGWLMSVDGYFNPSRWDGSENSQSVSNIVHGFPHWFGSRFGDFGDGNEPHAPWDQHWQRMLVAPRAQLSLEGVNNTHENPVGSQATYTAARSIYDW